MQSDQSIRCPHEETLQPWLSKNAFSENSDHTANAQADLNLHWARMSDCTLPDGLAHKIHVYDCLGAKKIHI